MAFLKFLVKKLNILVILLACLTYLVLFLFKLDVSYGSIPFAVLHVIVITTLLYSIFRLIFPLNKDEKSNKQVKNKINNEKPDKTSLKKRDQSNVGYFKVEQNPNYYFKEYDDRYELYEKTLNGMKYIKTDYKKDLKNNGKLV